MVIGDAGSERKGGADCVRRTVDSQRSEAPHAGRSKSRVGETVRRRDRGGVGRRSHVEMVVFGEGKDDDERWAVFGASARAANAMRSLDCAIAGPPARRGRRRQAPGGRAADGRAQALRETAGWSCGRAETGRTTATTGTGHTRTAGTQYHSPTGASSDERGIIISDSNRTGTSSATDSKWDVRCVGVWDAVLVARLTLARRSTSVLPFVVLSLCLCSTCAVR